MDVFKLDTDADGADWVKGLIETLDVFKSKDIDLKFSYKLSSGEYHQEVKERNVFALKLVMNKYGDKNIVIGSRGVA